MKKMVVKQFWFLLVWGFLVGGCQSQTAVSSLSRPAPTITQTIAPTVTETAVSIAEAPAPNQRTTPPTSNLNPAPPTPIATATIVPTATATQTPSPTATPTPIGDCRDRIPPDNLLTIVTQTYRLSQAYAPSDLVPLVDVFPVAVTNGYPTELRAVAIEPLRQLIGDMQTIGLQPNIISGYRSYAQQNIAYQKWVEKEPERASILSSRPGHSEHQLGTAVDFGSPELADIVGDPAIEFHTYFYRTSEGAWLSENAHHYGFTLSYPRTATDVTGFFYEPWHFRYVGVELATLLDASSLSLTEYQLMTMPEPCIPSS